MAATIGTPILKKTGYILQEGTAPMSRLTNLLRRLEKQDTGIAQLIEDRRCAVGMLRRLLAVLIPTDNAGRVIEHSLELK